MITSPHPSGVAAAGDAKSSPVERRVAVVTGAGAPGGLGAAIVAALARAGHRVVATDIADADIADADDPAGAHTVGDAEVMLSADLTSSTDCADLVEAVCERFGRIDILVNNAAAPAGADKNDIADVSVDAWDRVQAVNLRAAFLLMRLVVPVMRRGGWGRIVNVSSLVGLTGRPQRAAYAASKAGLIALSRSVALDVARDGITVNAVCPGLVRTERTTSALARRVADGSLNAVEDGLANLAAAVPLGRLAEPHEVADVVAFLASPAAAFVTGEALGVHGGELFAGAAAPSDVHPIAVKEPEHV